MKIQTVRNATKLGETLKITPQEGTSNKANVKEGSHGQSLRRLKRIAILGFEN